MHTHIYNFVRTKEMQVTYSSEKIILKICVNFFPLVINFFIFLSLHFIHNLALVYYQCCSHNKETRGYMLWAKSICYRFTWNTDDICSFSKKSRKYTTIYPPLHPCLLHYLSFWGNITCTPLVLAQSYIYTHFRVESS